MTQENTEKSTDAAAPVDPLVMRFSDLSSEAQSVIVGMVDACLERRLAMGMDEGFASFDPDIEYEWVGELREFVGA